eukprot:1250299-Rhodomonas_salina.2
MASTNDPASYNSMLPNTEIPSVPSVMIAAGLERIPCMYLDVQTWAALVRILECFVSCAALPAPCTRQRDVPALTWRLPCALDAGTPCSAGTPSPQPETVQDV